MSIILIFRKIFLYFFLTSGYQKNKILFMVPSIKGNIYNLTKEYLIQRFGVEALEKIKPHLTVEDYALISRPFIAGIWESEITYNNFLAAADKTFGKGDFHLCYDIGYNSALQGIPKIYKIFIRFGDPAFVIKRASNFWSQVHNHGRFNAKLITDHAAVATIYDYQCPNKTFCYSLMGYMVGVLELSGAKNVQIKESQCCLEDASCCEFIAQWN